MGDAFSVPFILSCFFILPIKHLIYLPINLHNHRIQFPLISRGFSCGKQLNKSPNTRNRVHLKDDNANLRAEVIIVTFFGCNNNRWQPQTNLHILRDLYILHDYYRWGQTRWITNFALKARSRGSTLVASAYIKGKYLQLKHTVSMPEKVSICSN